MYQRLYYDTTKYPFKETMEDILRVDDLSKIHEHSSWPLLTREEDQSTSYHKLYYAQYNDMFKDLWEKFVKEVLTNHFSQPIFYQKIPTFRVQIPGNVGVGEYHTDAEYGHTVGALNVFLPMVDVTKHNTIWAESEYMKGDYEPILLNYGEYALWDGVTNRHGNKLNPSDETRVSVDARLLEAGKYNKDSTNSSINMKVKLGPGGYFAEEAVS